MIFRKYEHTDLVLRDVNRRRATGVGNWKNKNKAERRRYSIATGKSKFTIRTMANENYLQEQVAQIERNLTELENRNRQCIEQQRQMAVAADFEKTTTAGREVENAEDYLSPENKLYLCEAQLYDCRNTIVGLETRLDQMREEKSSLELHFDETVKPLIEANRNLVLQIEAKNQNISRVQEKIAGIQGELEKQIERSNREKDSSLEEINKLQEQFKLALQKKAENFENRYQELLITKTTLECELSLNTIQLTNIQLESKRELEDISNKYDRVQEQLNEKQIELKEYVGKYDSQIKTIALLTSERDNLTNEINALKSKYNDGSNECNRGKLIENEKQTDAIETKNVALELEPRLELKLINEQLEIARHELTLQLGEKEKIISDLKEMLNCQCINLETKIKEAGELTEVNSILTSENKNLINETNTLKNQLLEKEKTLVSNLVDLNNFQTHLKELQTEKNSLKLELNDIMEIHSNCVQRELTEKIKSKLQEVEEQGNKMQLDLNSDNECIIDQNQQIKTLICENNSMIDEANILKESLDQSNYALSSNQDKLEDYSEPHKKIAAKDSSLMVADSRKKMKVWFSDQDSGFTKGFSDTTFQV